MRFGVPMGATGPYLYPGRRVKGPLNLLLCQGQAAAPVPQDSIGAPLPCTTIQTASHCCQPSLA
jgi:hypothetical protein